MNAADYYGLGDELREAGDLKGAIREYRRHLSNEPDNAGMWNNLGLAFVLSGKLDEAILAFSRAIEIKPEYAQAYANKATALAQQGGVTGAIALYRKATSLDPSDAGIHSGLLYTLCFESGMTQSRLIDEHRQWARRHMDHLWCGIHPNSPDQNRKLRIGYVSPNFKLHPIGRFMLPLLVEHDHAAFGIYLYSAKTSSDDLASKLKARASTWRDISVMDDAAAAELIRSDKIDILVDLSMHMGHHLGIFARKPAPVQITYLAYPGTTGLEAIDYRITDAQLEPHERTRDGEQFVEKPLYIPNYWCYKPSIWDADPAPPPSIANGFITFGCLNSVKKISPQLMEAWGRLLNAVPRSRMLLHAPVGDCRKALLGCFEVDGINPGRISFVAELPLPDYYRLYNQIDIALDSFPYNGGTTTCDALWMGIPVVTLAGDLQVSRMGASILNSVGARDWIASSSDEYIAKAIKLALGPDFLAYIHAKMRESVIRSPLFDAKEFTKQMELAYRKVWGIWCRRDHYANFPSPRPHT
jgi:protein O-GlcNAc transferase